MAFERKPGAAGATFRLWSRYLVAALLPLALVCLWRSPIMGSYRPTIAFGTPWRDVAMAWAPEGLLFGVSGFLAQRILAGDRGVSGFSLPAMLIYLILWMLVWCLGVIAPGGVVLDGFAASVGPLKETFLLGGPIGGLLAGGMTLVYAMLWGSAVLAALLIAAFVATLTMPAMTEAATSGKVAFGSTARFGTAVVVGGIFWIARLLVLVAVSEPLWRGILDAVATTIIIGISAVLAARPALPASLPPGVPGAQT